MSPYRASWQAKGILLVRSQTQTSSTSPLGQLDPETCNQAEPNLCVPVSQLSPSLWPYGQ